MESVSELPKAPERHPIVELTQQKIITIHQLSLRIGKSYGHTRNLIAGYAKPDQPTLQIFDQLMEEFNGKNKKRLRRAGRIDLRSSFTDRTRRSTSPRSKQQQKRRRSHQTPGKFSTND